MGRDAEAALKAAFESVAADVGEEELSRADLWLSIKSNNVLGDISTRPRTLRASKKYLLNSRMMKESHYLWMPFAASFGGNRRSDRLLVFAFHGS